MSASRASPSDPKPLPRDPQDALLLGNDILGLRAWGPDAQPTFSLGRSDIWDRRWFAHRQPLVTLARIRDLAMADRLSEVAAHPNQTVYGIYNQYDFPCPKPGVQLILGAPFATRSDLRPGPDGRLVLHLTGPGRSLRASVWVALTRPLVVLRLVTRGLSAGDLWLRVHRHADTILPGGRLDPTIGEGPSASDFEPLPAPEAIDAGDLWGIRQRFHGEATFPEGFAFAAVAGALGTGVRIERREGEPGLGTPLWAPREGRIHHSLVKRYTPINDAPGAAATATFDAVPASFALVLALATSHDGPDPLREACRWVEEARLMGVEGLAREQASSCRAATRSASGPRAASGAKAYGAAALCGRARARVGEPAGELELPVSPATACAIGGVPPVELAAPRVVAPNLRRPDGYYGDVPLCSVGPTKFWFQDAGLWHNDFHLNELRAEPMLTLGQFPELLPYCHMIRTLLEGACENARDVYGLPGAMFPLVHFPLRCRGVAHTNLTWEQDPGLNGLAAKPLWLYYRHTGDREFLDQTAYPVLAQCARFCAAYLSPGDDGRLHLVPSVSPEHWGLTPRFERNHDCASALTLTRYLLLAAADAAAVLGRDAAEAHAWRSAAARLAPLPTFVTPDGPIWVDVRGAPPIEYNIPVPLAPVFWGDEVGLDSPQETLQLARRTLERINVWEPHRPYLDACVRPRLGIYREGAPVGPENLLLSYQSIRIFPAVPPGLEAVMEDFAAQGGFRVWAVRTAQGLTREVRIRATLGGECAVANPWPGRGVGVRRVGGRSRSIDFPGDPIVRFETVAGRTYALSPLAPP